MFISDYVVKSPPITAKTRPSGRLRHIIKFATYHAPAQRFDRSTERQEQPPFGPHGTNLA